MLNTVFESVFTAAGGFTAGTFLICIGSAVVLGLIIAAVHIKTTHTSTSYAVTLAILPAIVAGLLRRFFPAGAKLVCKLGQWTFFLWITVLFLMAAKSSGFLRESQQTPAMLLGLGAMSFGICVLNFALGYWLGYGKLRRVSSQVLGQKNTSLTLYLALQYASPIAALGPAFYIFWHNLWNAIQLHFHARKKLISARNDAQSR